MATAFKLEDHYVLERILYRMGQPGIRESKMIKIRYDYKNFSAELVNLDENGEELTSQEMPIGRAENRIREMAQIGFQELNEFAFREHREEMKKRCARLLLECRPGTLANNIEHVRNDTYKARLLLEHSYLTKDEFLEVAEECYKKLLAKTAGSL